jgi:cobalamin-dependent methionine synthase I
MNFNTLQAIFCPDLVICLYFWFLGMKVLGGCGVLQIRKVIIDLFFFFLIWKISSSLPKLLREREREKEREREREMGIMMKLFFSSFL